MSFLTAAGRAPPRHAAVSDRGADTGDPGPPGLVKLEWLTSHLLCRELSVSWAPWALSPQASAVPCARKGGWRC